MLQIRDIFESANLVKSSYQKAQDSTLQYLQNLNVNKKVQLKVRDWFNYNWEQQKTLSMLILMGRHCLRWLLYSFISQGWLYLSYLSLHIVWYYIRRMYHYIVWYYIRQYVSLHTVCYCINHMYMCICMCILYMYVYVRTCVCVYVV